MLTALDLEFADGSYLFDLKLPQLAELQDKRRAGVFAIYARVLKGRYTLDGLPVPVLSEAEAFAEDLFETIRLGLIGGGRGLVDGAEVKVSALRARELIERYCHSAPLSESWSLAAAILGARIVGYEPPSARPEPTLKKKAARKTTSRSDKSSTTAQSSGATGAS